MKGLVVISGCSGGGKSTVLAELARRGFAVVPEPGRRIVAEEMASGGTALPWVDLEAFAHRALALALKDRAEAVVLGVPVFFDRGVIDAAAALQHVTGVPELETLRDRHRYDTRVFLVPPWPKIYVVDAARQHGFAEAVAEYGRLDDAYRSLGYHVVLVPQAPVGDRADAILAALRASG